MLANCSLLTLTTAGLPASLFTVGLIGGFTHCTGMCGPFVLAQSGTLKRISSIVLIPYHLGRMTTYVTLALLTNTILNLAFAASDLRFLIAAPMLAVAGVIFLVTAFPRLGMIFPWAHKIVIPIPYRMFSKASRALSKSSGILKQYGLGVLLGFMPCGLVLSALLAASSAPHAAQAVFAMAAFAVGTVPALIITAAGGNIFKKNFPRFSTYAFQGLIAVNGIWLIAIAVFLLK